MSDLRDRGALAAAARALLLLLLPVLLGAGACDDRANRGGGERAAEQGPEQTAEPVPGDPPAQSNRAEAVARQGQGGPEDAPLPNETSEEALLDAARRAVSFLAEGDFRTLAELVHPERGVRFSPYAYVDPEIHQILHPDDLRAAAAGDDPVRLWGHEDGTGEPIRLDLRTYVERRVIDAAFLEEGRVTVDRRQGRGNTVDNAAEVYPDARIVEYHVPGSHPDYGGLDWKSLRLAFVRHQGAWRLVGVIHDEWTI